MTLTAEENGPGMFEPLGTSADVASQQQSAVAMMETILETHVDDHGQHRVSHLSEYTCTIDLAPHVHGEQWMAFPYTPEYETGPTLYQYSSPVTSFERTTTHLHSPLSASSPEMAPVPFIDFEAELYQCSNPLPSAANGNHVNSLHVEVATGRHGPVRTRFLECRRYIQLLPKPTSCLSRYCAIQVQQRHTKSSLRTTSTLAEGTVVPVTRPHRLQPGGPADPTYNALVSELHTDNGKDCSCRHIEAVNLLC